MRLEELLRLNDLMTVCVHNLPIVILLILSPLRNESENESVCSVQRPLVRESGAIRLDSCFALQ